MGKIKAYFLVVILSFITAGAITTGYYFFRPTPISINEVSEPAISNSVNTTLTGIITKNSSPETEGNYFLQTNNALIILSTTTDLEPYLGKTVSVSGQLTEDPPSYFLEVEEIK